MNKDNMVFAPGCALMLYKPELAEKVFRLLSEKLNIAEKHMTCCQYDPLFENRTTVINVCPGCDKRFGKDYAGCSTISVWEILAENEIFDFPDYGGKSMAILDACPVRENEKVHIAVRKVLHRMNINVVEPKSTMNRSICCGDSFYGEIPVEKVKEQMSGRAGDMPAADVVVYCVSCTKSMFIGGKKPRYLIDLLYEEETVPGTLDQDDWHNELKAYIDQHH
jgi:Fe-S oxidoreductase